MKVLETSFVRGFIRVCSDGFAQNWHVKEMVEI